MKIKNVKNKVLATVATTVGAAGAVVLAASTGIALPVAAVAFAKQVLAWGALVGIVSAKVLPGNGKNAPKKDARGQIADAEEPR